jgi:hypothetical protein
MIVLKDLPVKGNGKVTLFLTGNFAVYAHPNSPNKTQIMDGIHNNGGWELELTVAEVHTLISGEIRN